MSITWFLWNTYHYVNGFNSMYMNSIILSSSFSINLKILFIEGVNRWLRISIAAFLSTKLSIHNSIESYIRSTRFGNRANALLTPSLTLHTSWYVEICFNIPSSFSTQFLHIWQTKYSSPSFGVFWRKIYNPCLHKLKSRLL